MPSPSSNMHPKTSPMVASFHDTDPSADYDKAIQRTRVRMDSVDPCTSFREFSTLITTLETARPSYTPRPCYEGWCWSMWTPHRSRITRRIDILSNEKNLHESNCQHYLMGKEGEANRQLRRDIEDRRMEAAEKYKKVTTEHGYSGHRPEDPMFGEN